MCTSGGSAKSPNRYARVKSHGGFVAEPLIKVIKVRHAVTTGYLLLTQDKMVFADLNPKMVSEDVSSSKAAEISLLYGAVREDAEAALKSGKIVDTKEKKALRDLFEAYRKTGEKNGLKSLSMEQVYEADHSIQLLDRIIPYSSVSNVSMKDQSIIVTQQMHRTPLAAKIYGGSTTWQFDVLEENDLFKTLVRMLHDLLPNSAFS